MNLDELRSTQEKERRKDSLQHLRDSFYDDVAAYIADLRASRDRRAERIENPFSDEEVRRISDEIDTAEDVAEALYQRRVGKVVKLASFAAADMPVDENGMTALERDLYDDLVARIMRNKENVLDVLAGTGASETATDVSGNEPDTPIDAVSNTDHDEPVPGQNHQSGDSEQSGNSQPKTTTSPVTDDSGMLADAMSTGADSESPTANRQSDSANSRSQDNSETQELDAAVPEDPHEESAEAIRETGEHPSTGEADTAVANGHPSTDGGAVSADTTQTAEATASADQSPPEQADASPDQPTQELSVTTSAGDHSAKAPDRDSEDSRRNAAPTQKMADEQSAPAGQNPAAADSPESASQAEATSNQHSDASSDNSSLDLDARTTVRITSEVGEIFAVDEREYDLKPDDIVTLPELNAKPLLEQGAATRLD